MLSIDFGSYKTKLRFFKEENVIVSKPLSLSFQEFPRVENVGKALRIEAVMFLHREAFDELKWLQEVQYPITFRVFDGDEKLTSETGVFPTCRDDVGERSFFKGHFDLTCKPGLYPWNELESLDLIIW